MRRSHCYLLYVVMVLWLFLKKKKKKNSCHLEIHMDIFRDDMLSGVCFKIK